MCTVSFYQDKYRTVVTSNRDEHIDRPTATAPVKKWIDGNWFYAPIDPQSQGTWFGVKQDGSIFVLLNGAEKKHRHQPPYRKSRGLILLEIIAANSLVEVWKTMDLEQIEPFTVISYSDKKLTQLRWDGSLKSNTPLDTKEVHIWSSATLYGANIAQERKTWLRQFLDRQNKNIDGAELLDFHTNTKRKDTENGLVINRKSSLMTKNITQCILENESITLTHLDLINKQQTTLRDYLL
ncbi:MAG: NRDE family protein [Bacteroidota bacterium]